MVFNATRSLYRYEAGELGGHFCQPPGWSTPSMAPMAGAVTLPFVSRENKAPAMGIKGARIWQFLLLPLCINFV